jgi:gamma-glutamylcyclotransferase (GGCT)/AIG2-like uncharacterized protein YtfP
LEIDGHLKKKDISDIFDYYLQKLKRSEISIKWIEKYGFEKTKNLLIEFNKMSGTDYLFVYGTLRNGYGLKLKNKVSDELEYLGKAKVSGSLYDLGRYPGAIKQEKKDEVIGDVFLVTNPEKVFKVLDKYEGEEFVREKEQVRLRSGKLLDAWVYWYNKKPEAKRKIRHKDYLNYLKYRKTA